LCLAAVWLIFRPVDWQRDLRSFAALFVLATLALAPYVVMLLNRDRAIDDVQLLVETRSLDLLRPPEIWSFVSLVLLSFGMWRKFFAPQNKIVLLTASLALVSFVVFNQQIITGRSLQPIHYQIFIVNYISLFAFILTLFLFCRKKNEALPRWSRFVLPLIALTAIIWGIVEVRYTTAIIEEANLIRDQARLVSIRLREDADSKLARDPVSQSTAVLPINLLQGDDLPTFTSQSVLWARHQHVFAGESTLENKRRFYHFLYFAGVNADNLKQQLREENVITVITLFGWDKLTTRLSTQAQPLTEEEIQNETNRFANFCANFNAIEAASLEFSYVVLNSNMQLDFTNIDRWYERDAGEKIKEFTLYRVRLREKLFEK
jgi:hypothetical protein